jgi:hypothetical protein
VNAQGTAEECAIARLLEGEGSSRKRYALSVSSFTSAEPLEVFMSALVIADPYLAMARARVMDYFVQQKKDAPSTCLFLC